MNDLSLIEAEFGDLSRFAAPPPFWCATPRDGMPVIQALRDAHVHAIGRSAGGRDILAIEYGQKQQLDGVTLDNLPSALASTVGTIEPTDIHPSAFYGENRRTQPVVVLQGALHGGELTGTVASLNLCRIIETGQDLRGRPWPELANLARETRLCIIPWLNIDGASRWPLHSPDGVSQELYLRLLLDAIHHDGTRHTNGQHKRIFPIPPERTAYMGAYYNDAGVNLQYDFTTIERQPETKAWMRYYLDERPDGVVIWHCNSGTMMGPPDFTLPEGMQFEQTRLAGQLYGRLRRAGYGVTRVSWAGLPGLGKPLLDQLGATYHVCGAMPVLTELPIFTGDAFDLDAMLDVGLIAIEEVLAYAHRDGFRPNENWEKVSRQLRHDNSQQSEGTT